ncbi:hypothetical protein M9Y10_042336 [Tritrichomonas musculus]|uniref:Amino acid transporter transmembrane domain-containing protein n=1 Tax=Tritrichomonas musculus TaxID=1915356 RepID=A0ABR2GPT1_9EUKA
MSTEDNQLSIEEPVDIQKSKHHQDMEMLSNTMNTLEENTKSSEEFDEVEVSDKDKTETKDENDKMDRVQRKNSSFFEALMNSLNSVLGAGILSVPNSFISVGLVPSLILIFIMAILSYVASIINVKLNLKYDSSGFDEIVEKLMGKVGSISYSVITIIFLWAGLVAFTIIAGDTLISWFAFGGIDISPFKYRSVAILIYSIIIPIALSIPKSFKIIGIFSTFSIGFIFFYAIASIVKVCQIVPQYGISPTVKIAHFDIQIFSALSVYALAFSLPCVIIPILSNYPKVYKKRRNLVITSFGISAFLTIFPSVMLYLIFGNQSDGNILNSFPSNDILFTVVRVGFFLIVSFSFPVIAKSCMSNWSHLLFKINDPNSLSTCKYWSVFVLTVSVPVLLGMFLPQCKPAMTIGGALGGCLGCYTYPSILNILSSERKWTVSNVLSGLFAIFGTIIAVISTYTSVVDAINAFKTDFHSF